MKKRRPKVLLRRLALLLAAFTLLSLVVYSTIWSTSASPDQRNTDDKQQDRPTSDHVPNVPSGTLLSGSVVALPAATAKSAFCRPDQETLVSVLSEAKDSHKRTRIRSSFGWSRLYWTTKLKVVFVVLVDFEPGQERADEVLSESHTHGDLLLLDLKKLSLASPHHAVLAMVAHVLKFHADHCAHVQFHLMANQDTLVDSFQLHRQLHFASSLPDGASTASLMLCHVRADNKPVRNVNSTFFVSAEAFPDAVFPPHCTSEFIVLSVSAVHRLAAVYANNAALDVEAVPFYTVNLGILARRLNISVVNGDYLLSLGSSDMVWGEATFSLAADDSKWHSLWTRLLVREGLDDIVADAENNVDLPHVDDFAKITIDVDVCATSNRTFLVIVVHTSPDHFEYRTVIRETWGSSEVLSPLSASLIFFVGRSEDMRVEAAINEESHAFGDIVQADFVDSYHNLVYKALCWMKWLCERCSSVEWVLKTDDDIVVDVPSVVNYLNSVDASNKRNEYHCLLWKHMRISRDPNNKWYISETALAGSHFPPYCSGSAFLLSPDVANKSLAAFNKDHKFAWIDDAYLTGILASRAGVGHVDLRPKYWLRQVNTAKDVSSDVASARPLFAHMSGAHRHDLRRRLWTLIYQAGNSTGR